MWQTNLGLLCNIHLLLGLVCVLPLMENIQSIFKFAQRKDIFICHFIATVKVFQGQLYTLYCDTTSSYTNEFWSFQALVQGDHEQIHMKWVMDQNTNNIEHLVFVSNVEKTWAHQGVICPNIGVMLLMTQTTFTLVMQLVKAKCKHKLLAFIYFFKFIDSLKF